MPKKKLTPAEKAKRTRDAKKRASLDELGFERKKVKRRRKPMSEEQKKAAVERLAKAREARGADGSKSVHHSIRDLDEDHFLHWKKVKEWLKSSQDELKGMKSYKDSKVSKERAQYIDLEVYISNMKKYLTGGVWCDSRYGERREGHIQKVCLTMAYNDDGTPKRTYGTWYPDIAQVWTHELAKEFTNDLEYANMYKKDVKSFAEDDED